MSKFRKTLDGKRSCFILPRDDIVGEVLIPAFSVSDTVDCMMGFFTASSLSEIGPGLATFLKSSKNPLRLVISPYLSANDQKALRDGICTAEELSAKALIQELPDADQLARHTLACLAWLLQEGRLQIRIAVMRDSLFHSKVWIFGSEDHYAALHGSMNMTGAALRKNREHITLSRDWKGEEPQEHVTEFQTEFEGLWSGGDEDCFVLDLPDAIEREVLRNYDSSAPPHEDEYCKAWRKAHGFDEIPANSDVVGKHSFEIPSFIEFEEGDFAHQGRAVKSWRDSSWRGILDMATGSGKTIASMIGTHFLLQKSQKLFVVVSAPYRPLIAQWCDEIAMFGVRPLNLTLVVGRLNRDKEIKRLGRKLRLGISNIEIVVVSNKVLCTNDFVQSVGSVESPKLLIADECHNLGASGFTSNPPEMFDFRLGLSATPDRQYDEEGTQALKSFFGEICFRFEMEEAIGKCLVPYDYYVHVAHLDSVEMDEWYDLCSQISELAWKFGSKKADPYLDNLLRKRRLVLETAAQKVGLLDKALTERSPSELAFTLIYATDKDPAQLNQVNQLLNQQGVLFHQLTYEETSDRAKTKKILDAFQSGELAVLTAKRVLDEGVNIPQIKSAFILASTTVKRQWIQRRGRLLRTCKEINKTHAEIHDFVTLPPQRVGSLDSDARKLVQAELNRVWEFSRLSRNGAEEDGAYRFVNELQELLS